MDRFMDKIGDAIAPIAQKMTANRYLSAIKEGFFGSTPILIAGSFSYYSLVYLSMDILSLWKAPLVLGGWIFSICRIK